jgi:transcriptional regulator with XRE-family HTH domain
MTLGEQLKKLRQDKGLSQPEMSELAGIEQSYLSKLENNKSIPSNEIFRSLLQALTLTLEEFLAGIDKTSLRQSFCQVPDIEYWLKQQDKVSLVTQRNYLYCCSLLIVIAVTLFYIGASKQVFSEVRYQYESRGVVLAGEPKDIFSSWSRLISGIGAEHRTAMQTKAKEMALRHDSEIFLTDENLGAQFVMDVVGGSRLFTFDKAETVPRTINAWLQVIGVLLFSIGIMGFLIERRLYCSV